MTKISLSVELPIQLLDLSDMLDEHFIIASYCETCPEYLDYYSNRKDKKFTILDNGAFENGVSMPVHMYDNIVRIIKPDVVVLPDVVNDARATMYATQEFLDQTQTNVPCYMGVLQGTSIEDYMLCLLYYINMQRKINIRVIGIPYHIFYRPTLLRKYDIHDICKDADMQIHILGLPNPFELLSLRNFEKVSSVDSSLPVSAAWHGLELSKKDWIEGYRVSVDEPINNVTRDLTKNNIETLKGFCIKDNK